MCKIFDSHAHYDDEKFEGAADELLMKMHVEENVDIIVNAGAGVKSSENSKRLSEKYDFIYFTAGIHPENAHAEKNKIPEIEKMLHEKKCVAVGEIGLDYYYGKETESIQKEVFRSQMDLAGKLGMPVVIHDRDAHADCLEIIKDYKDSVKGVFHSFSGSFEMLREILKFGYYFSVNGIITFKNARKSVELLQKVKECGEPALSRMLVETDSPYLTPVPLRGSINNSGYIKYTASKASEILGISYEEFLNITYENACRFYNIKKIDI